MVRRVVVLVLLGALYNGVVHHTTSFAELRFTGVLQVFAAMIIGLSLLAKINRTPLAWLGSAFLVLGSQTAFLMWWRATRCDGVLSPDCNPSLTLDPLIFGASHVYRAGERTDPEGIVMMWGAIGCAALGAAVGSMTIGLFRKMQRQQVTTAEVLATFLTPAAVFLIGWMITATALVGIDLPAVKRIWTVSLTLQVAAGITLVLLLGFLLFDSPRRPETVHRNKVVTCYPIIEPLGRNALLIYILSHLVYSLLTAYPVGSPESLSDRIIAAIPGGQGAVLLWLALVMMWLVVAWQLDRRRWYFRA